jgi:hypothetical protein
MSRSPFFIFHSQFFIFICILGLATFLRLFQLDLIDVRFDEASVPQAALAVARGQFLAVVPFSGSVANHPALMLYILAVPYLFTKNFLVVAGFRAMLDVAAIALTWQMCHRYFGLRVAHVAALLFAVAPWAVQTARKTSGEALPLFSVLLLCGLLEVFVRHNPRGWAWAGWGLALAMGVHLSAWVLLPVALVCMVMGLRTLQLRPVLIGLAPCVLLAAVYFGHDAAHNFTNLTNLTNLFREGKAPQFSLLAVDMAQWLSGGTHLSDLTGPAFAQWQAQWPAWLERIDTVQLAWFWASVVWCAVAAWARKSKALLLLLLWLFIPTLLNVRGSQPVQIHYLLPLLPLQFVLMALAFDWLTQQTARYEEEATLSFALRRLAPVLLLFVPVVLWQLFTTLRFYDFVQRHNTSPGGYGPPLRNAWRMAELARAQMRAGAVMNAVTDVIVVTPGGDPLVDEPATLFDVLLADVPHRFANAEAGLILRNETAQYIFAPGTARAQAELAGVGAKTVLSESVPLRTGSSEYYIYQKTAAVNVPAATQARWANGVALISATAKLGQPTDVRVRVHTLLRVTQLQPTDDFHWFNHVLAGGQKVGQMDGGGVQTRNWRVGDVLLHWFDIAVPTGAARPEVVRLGCYKYPQIEAVPLLDVAGNPFDDGVNVKVEIDD